MKFMILISSLAMAFLLITTLGLKWQIRVRDILVVSTLTGSLTGVILSWFGLSEKAHPLVIVLLELFVIMLLFLIETAFMFYRDPERICPVSKNIVVSPADGKVLYVKSIKEGESPLSKKKGTIMRIVELSQTDLLVDGGYLIGIGMNLFNVHINRAPIGGRVMMLRHIEGKFLSLKEDEAVIKNERFVTVIKNETLIVGVIQIASRLVRTIVSYLNEDQEIQIGQKIGMIRFGSQVDIVLPKIEGLNILIKQGDEVVAGVSFIAEY